jgi:hypothetical protein
MQPTTDAPLTPSIARRLIVSVLEAAGRPMKRNELAQSVVAQHLASGGTPGQQPPQRIVKKALGYLQEDGRVEKADGFARWRLRPQADSATVVTDAALEPLDSSNDEHEDSDPVALGSEPPAVAGYRRLGSGPECVYVYYYPNDQELAQLKGCSVWGCKIGKTESTDPTARIAGQGARTARPQPPTVALVIQTDDCSALERALHSSLRLLDAQDPNAEGDEWFLTNPEQIERWYMKFQEALTSLRPPAR